MEGIDANNNGIRDEVELTILLWHKDSARVRAAELQYAMAMQMMLDKVFNSETWVAAAEEEGRGFLCMRVRTGLNSGEVERIENLVLDTDLRREKYKEVHRKYEVSYSSSDAPACDIDFNSLPN